MEARFLNTPGPLAKKLMAAMQGANVPGADSRCLDEGTSSKSAFLRVAKPDDDPNDLYLEINIDEEPDGVEPINSLQVEFDAWCDTALVNSVIDLQSTRNVSVYPNPSNGVFNLLVENTESVLLVSIYDLSGKLVHRTKIKQGLNKVELNKVKENQLVLLNATDENGVVVHSEKIQILRK